MSKSAFRTLAAVALGLVLLSSTEGSFAAWSDTVGIPPTTVTTDKLALAVGPLPSGSAAKVSNTAARTTALWAPTSLSVGAGGVDVTPALSGTTITYLTGPGCATATWSATAVGTEVALASVPGATVEGGRLSLGAGQTAEACLAVVPGEALLRAYAGQTLTVTTILGAAASGPAGWTSGPVTWDSSYAVPGPVLGSCAPVPNDKTVTLRWSWPGPDPVGGWDVLRWDRAQSRWVSVDKGVGSSGQRADWPAGTTLPGTARSVTVRPETAEGATDVFKVRMHAAGGHVDTPQVFAVTGVNENADKVECGGPVADPHTGK